MTLPLAVLGGRGVISAVANLVPGDMVAYTKASVDGNLTEARALHRKLAPLIEAVFIETNPIPVKTAMAMLGKCTPELRLPLSPISPANRDRLKQALVDYGLKVTA